MKKSLIALAALAASGASMAQSSVTLFGIVDAAYGHVSANGTSASGITNSGINSSRLGVRGTEDLGGGLSGSFHLEGALANDNGTPAGLNFQRRSTVSLSGAFGEVRVGRDYTPTFWNTTVYDAFGTNGVAQSRTPNALGLFGVSGATGNAVRANNSIGYFLPGNLGGFNGQVQVAFGENTGGVKTNNYFGFRLGYTQGPISAHVANGKTKGATDAADVTYTNFAGSYDLGAVKLLADIVEEKNGAGAKVKGNEVSLVAPVGAGEVRASYNTYKLNGSASKANQLGLGYVHNLSKRTALYAQYANISNKGGATIAVANNGLSAGAAAAGGKSSGYEVGVRHSF
ncbi:MAG: hypothetical protein RLZZ584_926 [Pseudomonadota bacterium]|jgi:predicted porin